jgi:hypothetical protein
MWPKFFNSKWFERLFTVTLSIIILLITQRLTVVHEDKVKADNEKSRIEAEINSKAPYTYVDKKDKELKDDFQKKIDEAKSNVDKTITTFSDDMNDVRNDVHEIRNFIFSRKLTKLNIDSIKPLKRLEGYIKLEDKEKSNSLLIALNNIK